MHQLERKIRSDDQCCKKPCEVGDVISETDSFKINHKFNYNDKCLVYLATSKICSKQYTGHTTDSFRSRWKKYKSKSKNFDKNVTCMPEHPSSHFENNGKSLF